MQPTDADSTFDDLVRRQLIEAYGPETFTGLEFSTEPGSYLAARAEADAEYARFKAETRARAEAAAGRLNAAGILPNGCQLTWELE